MKFTDLKCSSNPRTIKNYNSLRPDFQPWVVKVLAELESLGWEPIIFEGRRTIEEQREKVRLGYSKTMKSRHLTGYAVDIVDKDVLWKDKHPKLKDYAETIQAIAEDLGLISGAIWKSFGTYGDYAHVECPQSLRRS